MTNVCSGTPTTIREIAEGIADQYGRRDLLKFGKRPCNFLDPPKVIRCLIIPYNNQQNDFV